MESGGTFFGDPNDADQWPTLNAATGVGKSVPHYAYDQSQAGLGSHHHFHPTHAGAHSQGLAQPLHSQPLQHEQHAAHLGNHPSYSPAAPWVPHFVPVFASSPTIPLYFRPPVVGNYLAVSSGSSPPFAGSNGVSYHKSYPGVPHTTFPSHADTLIAAPRGPWQDRVPPQPQSPWQPQSGIPDETPHPAGHPTQIPTLSPPETASNGDASSRVSESVSAQSTHTTQPHVPASSASAVHKEERPAEARLDRYAPSYIPNWLKLVNLDPNFTYVPLEEGGRQPFDHVAFAQTVWPMPLWKRMQSSPQHSIDHTFLTSQHTQSDRASHGTDGSFSGDAHGTSDRSEGRSTSESQSSAKSGYTDSTVTSAATGPVPPLSRQSYAAYWQPILASESSHCELDLADCALYAQHLRPYATRGSDKSKLAAWDDQGLYILDIPGVREERPKLAAGDRLYLRPLSSQNTHPSGWLHLVLECCITAVRAIQGQIVISCPALEKSLSRFFRQVQDFKVNVIFVYEPKLLQDGAAAVDMISRATDSKGWLEQALFARSDSHRFTQPKPQSLALQWVDSSLNPEQRAAVASIVSHHGSAPFLLSGPPGTGKTKSSVEAILQLARGPHKLLVVAPSHAAADVLTSRLGKHLLPEEMFRLNAPARTFAEVPQSVSMYCYVDENTNAYGLPPWPRLMKFTVVVSTTFDVPILLRCKTASNIDIGILQSYFSAPLGGDPIPRLHWTHLLVDEAAQGTEPDIAPAIATVMPHEKCEQSPTVILVGDMAQLGPEVRSTLGRSRGLDVSLLERLSRIPAYRQALNVLKKQGRAIVLSTGRSNGDIAADGAVAATASCGHLIRNYRARHPALLHHASTLFYADSLVPCALPTARSISLLNWSALSRRGVKTGLPLLFLDTRSHDEWVDEGVSWKNEGEAAHIVRLCQSLMAEVTDLKAESIAVISPFREQVWRIRILLRQVGLGAISVGPVEAFQGQEADVVFVSTVRSRTRFVARDKEMSVGLIGEPKRLNVALTRARELLVIVGNADCLSACEEWRHVVAHARRNRWIVQEAKQADDRKPAVDHIGQSTGERISALEAAELSGSGWWDKLLKEAGLYTGPQSKAMAVKNLKKATEHENGGEADAALLAGRMATVALQEDDDDDEESDDLGGVTNGSFH